jgi:hypothetical protein
MKTDSIAKRVYLMSDRQILWLKHLVDRAIMKRGLSHD